MTLDSEQQLESAGGELPSVELKLDMYTFIEEEGGLRVVWSRDNLGCALAFGGGLVVASIAALYFMLPTNWADASGWLLIPAALAALGLWLLARTIRHWRQPARDSVLRRTYWLFDKQSGAVYRHGKFFRTMSSITHIGIWGMEAPKEVAKGGVVYYVWLAPYQGYAFTKFAPGLVQGQIVFGSMKDASQAATLLANYLGVEVVSGWYRANG